MNTNKKRLAVKKRFNELVSLEAHGLATKREIDLLNRYQRLLRTWHGRYEVGPELARMERDAKLMMKRIRAIAYANDLFPKLPNA